MAKKNQKIRYGLNQSFGMRGWSINRDTDGTLYINEYNTDVFGTTKIEMVLDGLTEAQAQTIYALLCVCSDGIEKTLKGRLHYPLT